MNLHLTWDYSVQGLLLRFASGEYKTKLESKIHLLKFINLLHYFLRLTPLKSAILSLTALSLERLRRFFKKKLHQCVYSQTINDELAYFARTFILAFLTGTLNNHIAGELAPTTANDWDTTVLKGIDRFFTPPRDSCPMYSIFTFSLVN